MKNVEFKRGNIKATLFLLMMLFCLVILFFLFLKSNSLSIRILSIFPFFIVSFLLYVLLKKIGSINLTIDENGIFDNSNYISVGMIYWEDIFSINSIEKGFTSSLIIKVKNPNKYIDNEKGFKKFLLNQNFKIFGTPVFIYSFLLNCKFKTLRNTILENYNYYNN